MQSDPAAAGDADFTVSVQATPAAAETAWRRLEAEGVLTPYQRIDWMAPLLESRPPGLAARCAIGLVEDGAGPALLLPFLVARRAGTAVARLIGSDVANADWLPMRRDVAARLTPQLLARLLHRFGAGAGGIDVIVLHNQPAAWQGIANPLLGFAHQPAPDHLHLGATAASPIRRSGKHLRNLQRGRRRLAEALGPLEVRRAETEAEIARVHRVFLEQRSQRFAEMGIANVFAEPWFVDFFRRAARGQQPALRFDALYAGEEIVATSCCACGVEHYSQYINSTSSGPAAKYSLMGILMDELVTQLQANGVASLDMGLGDFPYKLDWTDPVEVYDAAIGLTPRGRAVAQGLLALRALKRGIKRNPRLFGALKRARALLGTGGGRRPAEGPDG